MKLNILLRYAFKAFVVVLLLSSCRDEVIDLPCEKEDVPIRPKTLLEEAQEYSEKTGDVFCPIFEKRQSAISRSQQLLIPDWKCAKVKESYDRQVIEVPLLSKENKKVKVKKKSDEGGQFIFLPVTSKLLIHKNKKSGKFYQYVSSTMYLDEKTDSASLLDSLQDRTLTIDYNANHEIYSAYEIVNGKFHLLSTRQQKNVEPDGYEVNVAGEPQMLYSYMSSRLEKLQCPLCDTELTENNYCRYHGYILEDNDVDAFFSDVVFTITRNYCNVVSEAFSIHWGTPVCNGACQNYPQDLMVMICDKLAMCVGMSFSFFYEMSNQTSSFTDNYMFDKNYLYMSCPDREIWVLANDYLKCYDESLMWNLTMVMREYDLMWNIPEEPDPDPDPDPNPPGGGEITDPIEDKTKIRAVLTLDISEVDLMETYGMRVDILPGSDTGPLIPNTEELELLIRRKGTEQWLSLSTIYDNSKSVYYERVAISPGFFEIKAEVHIDGGDVLESNVETVEEKFPSIDAFDYLPHVQKEAVDLWNKAVQYATENKNLRRVREYGCFIYLNTEYGTYECGRTIEGDTVTLNRTVTASVNFEYDEILPDPRETGYVIVGTIHSHYPLTWAVSGLFRDVGPSSADKKSDLPGILYDYKYRVYAGDAVDMKNNPKTYRNYGSERRVTLEI